MLRGTCQYYLAYRANTSAREAALLRMLEADFADSYHGTRGKLKHKGGELRRAVGYRKWESKGRHAQTFAIHKGT